jgi:hypothetical protein
MITTLRNEFKLKVVIQYRDRKARHEYRDTLEFLKKCRASRIIKELSWWTFVPSCFGGVTARERIAMLESDWQRSPVEIRTFD